MCKFRKEKLERRTHEKRCSVLKSVNYHKFVLFAFSFSVSPCTSVQKEERKKPQNNDKKKIFP